MATLHLSVKKEYFFEMKDFSKIYEYRLRNEYWTKRLVDRDYDEIQIKMGYPRKDDFSKVLHRPYLGYEEQTITHPHFGDDPVDVFAIFVN